MADRVYRSWKHSTRLAAAAALLHAIVMIMPWLTQRFTRNDKELSPLVHVFSLGLPYISDKLENLTSDLLFYVRAKWYLYRGVQLAPSPNVAVVGLDEPTYEELNLDRLAVVPRRHLAAALNYAADSGAAGAALDLVFIGPSSDPEGDAMLEAAMRRLPVITAASTDTANGNITAKSALFPPVENAAHAIATVSYDLDEQVARRFSQPAQVIDERTNTRRTLLPLGFEAVKLISPSAAFPPEGALINFYSYRYPTYFSLYRLADPARRVPPEKLKGKVLFFGAARSIGAAIGTLDEVSTPYRWAKARTPGVEIHAFQASNILRNHWIKRFPIHIELLASLLFFWVASMVYREHPGKGWRIIGLYAVLLTVLAVRGYTQDFVHVPGVLLSLALLGIVYADNAVYFFTVYRRREEAITRTFGYYLAPELVQQISSDPSQDRFTLKSHDAAILFTDIERFTSLCEKVSGDELTNILTTYFQEAANAVREELGVVITFTGDGMFAIWGAPVSVDHPQERAVRAALKIQSRIAELAAQGKIPELKTRIGIHYGKLFAGTIGGEGKLQYTAVGDAVNVASRFESACKQLGVSILVTEEIAKSLSDKYPVNDLGLIQVPGKEEKLRAYTLT